MKKMSVVLAVLICVMAFVPRDLGAGVGIKGGYTLSKFLEKPSGSLPWANLPFYTGGLYFSLSMGFVTIQPEVLYTRMGGRVEVDAANSLEFWFDYIQVPVLLKFNIVPAGPIRPFLYGGGYGGYLIKATGVMVEDGTELPRMSLMDTYEKLDYGVLGGVGLTFKLPGIAITVEGRYNYGLKNLIIDPAEGEFMRNTSIMALVGIGF
jgi:hypothetical protein